MQLLANMQRPLTALIFLAAACSGREGTVLDGSGRAEGSSANALELGPSTATVAFDALPACTDVAPGSIYFVDAPSNQIGFYGCDSEGAWQLLGLPVDSSGGSAAEHLVECDPTAPDAGAPAVDGGTTGPVPVLDAGGTEPIADAGAPSPSVDAGPPPPPPPPPLGACLECARTICSLQYANAVGSESSPENFALVDQLLSCVIGADWAAGAAIPAGSCYFADPSQPAGTLVPCYCGSTPTATCLATGPADANEACGREIELASGCSPVSASCVTVSGSNPAVALGDTLQLLNCERAACQAECGFPAPIEE